MGSRGGGGQPAPHVLIVGGFTTSPPFYWPLARRLERRGAAAVHIAPIWTPDWLLAAGLGMDLIVRRAGRAIARAYQKGGRQPVLVVGHSAGGIISRLAMSPVPYGRPLAAVGAAVGALVTLGSPHTVPNRAVHRRRAGFEACAFLERTTPGSWFAPRTGYVTVGSRAVQGTSWREGSFRTRVAGLASASLLGADGATSWSDGLIPERCAHLVGARQVTLDGVLHGTWGGPWYGDPRVLDLWWPLALECWREALEARAAPVATEIEGESDPIRVAR